MHSTTEANVTHIKLFVTEGSKLMQLGLMGYVHLCLVTGIAEIIAVIFMKR
jgi:hypothetical protein